MIYPPISKLSEKTDSRYSLVIAAAKRAREISEESEKEVAKPVIAAINEIYNGEVDILSAEEAKKKRESKIIIDDIIL